MQHFTSILSNSYLAILITLHRNFLPPTPDFPRPKPLPESQSLSHCVEAARSVIHMAATQRDLVPPSHHLAVMCQFLWTSAIILLLCEVHRRDPVVADAVGPQIDSCRRSLQALEPVWPGSRKLKELLNDAEKRTKEVVVAARPRSSSHKKRKPAGHIERPMGPPASTSPSHRRPNSSGTDWQGYQSLPDGTDQLKRARTDAPRYETSDTRTNLREDAHSFQAWDANSLPAQAAVGDLNPSLTDDGLDMTFDIGGVDFNGLEMLQGFTGADLTSFWNTLASDPFMPNTRQSPPIAISDRNTPRPGSGPGTGPGLSPSTWTFQNSPMGMGGSGSGSGVGVAGGEAEFWNQVAGESFDWAADPSMPFNI